MIFIVALTFSIIVTVCTGNNEVETVSQTSCTSVNQECGTNRDGIPGTGPHGPYCCEEQFQGCCTTHYGDLHASCVNRSSDMWMNECQSFCQFDIERHTAGSQFLSTCYKTMFQSENKFLYSLSSSLFNGTLVDPSYDNPPPQTCTVGCMNGCVPRDIGCRWNSTLHLPELYDVATGAVITDDQPVVNYTGTTNNDANNDAFNITYDYCYEFNLPIGSVGYRDAPSIDSNGDSVACDESNLPYVVRQTENKGSLQDFCLAACDEDAGFEFQLIFASCNQSSDPSQNNSFIFNPDGVQCKCKLGMRVDSSDPSRCEYCPKNQYMDVESYSFECLDCPYGRTSSEKGASECEECDIMFVGSSDCSIPVLGLVLGSFVLLLLGVIVLVFIMRTNMIRLREKMTKLELSEKEALLKVTEDDRQALREGWVIGEDSIIWQKNLAAGSEGEVWLAMFRGYKVAAKKLFDSDGIDLEKNDEIAFLQRARHSRLVLFLGCGRLKKGGIFLVLEYCDSGSMRDYLIGTNMGENKAPVRSWAVRMSLLCDVAEGMKYLHTHGAVHRDLKMDNVLLDSESRTDGSVRAKVADFGLSRLVGQGRTEGALRREAEARKYADSDSDSDDDDITTPETKQDSTHSSTHSSTSTVQGRLSRAGFQGGNTRRMTDEMSSTMTAGCGTPAYMAPEIIVNLAKNVHHYGQPVDVYSFAIIMYETLELRPAWIDAKHAVIIWQTVEEGGRPVIKAPAPCSSYVELMKKAWEHDPESRPVFDTILTDLRSIRKEIDDLALRRSPASAQNQNEGSTAVEIEMS